MAHAVGVQDDAGWFTAAVAEELRAQMARKRVSGRELARRLHVSAQWISQRTKGAVPLSTDEIERISLCLGVTPMQMLQGAANSSLQPSAEGHTGVDTRRYVPASSQQRGQLSLVPPPGEDYRAVDARYGSSAPDSAGVRAEKHDPYPVSGNGAAPSVPESAGAVNHAYAA